MDGEGFEASIRTTLDVTDQPMGEGRTLLKGSAQEVLGDVRAYQEAGADYMVLGPRGRAEEQVLANMVGFARRVIPSL